MRITDIISINIKKLKTRTKKAMFLIIPVLFLISLSVIITSQVNNIKNAMKVSVFDSISEQYTLLQVKVQQEEFNPTQMFKGNGSVEENRYSESDTVTVESIEGVKNAELQTTIPVNQITTSNLFTGKDLRFNNLTTISKEAAKLYTEEDFSYIEGEAIPIILNASTFINSYEDWSEGNTIKLEAPKMDGTARGEPKRISFMKTESIEYDKEKLIGSEFTLAFGGLTPITDYEISRDNGEVTMNKLTDNELNSKVEERKEAISKYWDYTKISTPKTYTFRVVGVIEDESSASTFIPTEFANTVMTDLIENEINSRKTSNLPDDILNSDFMGLTYNGDEITQGFGGFMGQIGRKMVVNIQGRPGGAGEVNVVNGTSGTTIPGLIVEINDDNEVIGEVSDKAIYQKANKYGDSISVVIDSISDRSDVIRALNKAGYAYQDLSDLEVIEKLEDNLSAISNGLLASFVILLVVTVVFTMSKYVSESTKEIGIFRAIGMTSTNVLTLFILQSLIYITIGYVLGLAVGVGINTIASDYVNIWFESFVNDTVSQSISVVNTVDKTIFTNVNWSSIGMYTGILFIVSLIVSMIPSYTASKISPVEAMKSE